MRTKRRKGVEAILRDLNFFYADLYKLIIVYDTSVPWEGKQLQEIKIAGPWRIVTDQKYLYLSMQSDKWVARYNVETLQYVDKFPTTRRAGAIDVSGNELYVSEIMRSIKVFNILTKEIIREWKPIGYSCAIKVHNGNLYYANIEDNKIYVYNLLGELIQQFGKSGSEPGELSKPYGMDIDDQFVYIVEFGNSRVQVFHLFNYTSSHHWGNQGRGNGRFRDPAEIRLHEDFCYVGDVSGVQMFGKDGEFLYRFGTTTPGDCTGEFRNVTGILVLNNCLYVCDSGNSRLQVFQ